MECLTPTEVIDLVTPKFSKSSIWVYSATTCSSTSTCLFLFLRAVYYNLMKVHS